MSLSDYLEAAKNSIAEIRRSRTFKKNNKTREETAQLQSDLAKCRGKLEICKNEFNRNIRAQCSNIRLGQSEGMDTLLQEQILWNAAMGYLLVRDAIYAVRTVNSYDSVEHAYKLLEEASEELTKPGSKSRRSVSAGIKERDEYGYITSRRTRKEKEKMLELFFDKLKLTGDIEHCIEELNSPAAQNLGLASGTYSSIDEEMRRLRGTDDTRPEQDFSVRPAGLDNFYSPSGKE